MKEFVSQTGGRYTYIDDIMNLQELSLAFASIFDGCDNFIISGCKVSGNQISSGFVYLNGKIRHCAATTGLTKFPIYICENNSVESVSYANAETKVGRNVYGCSISNTIPATIDPLTKQAPQFITVQSDGSALTLKDAFFGKYALMIDSPRPSQTVNKDVTITGNLVVGKKNILTDAVFQDDLQTALLKKANAEDVYSKTAADEKFVKLKDGIEAFVTEAGGGDGGREAIRKSIKAASLADLKKTIQKSQLLLDMINEGLPSTGSPTYQQALLERQKTVCKNIGAPHKSDVPAKPKDTGWLKIEVSGHMDLHVRQIGNMVSIQGFMKTIHHGKIFTLPNSIDPPPFKIGYSHNKEGEWHCTINGGSRDCMVDKCSGGCGENIGFLMTYMV